MKKKNVKSTKEKIINAIIAGLIIIALTSGNFLITGKEVIAFATDMKLNSQTEDTLNKYVKFDTFFMQDNERTHYLIHDINENDQNMYMNISVKQGYLKNVRIELLDKNYKIEEIEDNDKILQEITDKKIILNQINSNEKTDYSLIAKIGAKFAEKVNPSEIQKESKIIFKAEHVDNNGKEKKIEKEIKINVGFYQDVKLNISR